MKMRVVRTNATQDGLSYAILYPDGTMLRDMNLSTLKYASQRAHRNRDVWALWEFLAGNIKPEHLSANRYANVEIKAGEKSLKEKKSKRPLSKIERWDTAPDGSKIDDMAIWGCNRVQNQIVLTDDNKLIIYNENLIAASVDSKPMNNSVDCEPDESEIHRPQPMKMRLIKTKDNLREGMYLLYADGTLDTSIKIDELEHDGCKPVFAALEAPENVDKLTSRTGERWDVDTTDMSAWGGPDAVNEFVITGDGKLHLFDSSLLVTLQLAQRAELAVPEKPHFIPLAQYAQICMDKGLLNDKFVNAYGIEMREATPEQKEERMKMECIHLMSIAKKCVARDTKTGDGYTDVNKGFNKGAVSNVFKFETAKSGIKKSSYYFKVYYPEDTLEYAHNQGAEDGVACLPMYPVRVNDQSTYKPVILTENDLKKISDSAKTESRKAVANKSSAGSNKSEGVYKAERELIAQINQYKTEGKTLDEAAELLFEAREEKYKERFENRYKTDSEDIEMRRRKAKDAVQRRWGSVAERKKTIYDSASADNKPTKEQVAEETGFTEDYVVSILVEIVNAAGPRYYKDGFRYEVGLEALNKLGDELKRDIAQCEIDKVKGYLDKGVTSVAEISFKTKIEHDRVREIMESLGAIKA